MKPSPDNLARATRTIELPRAEPGPEPLALAPITVEELTTARLTPRVIVPDYLYADVRNLIGAGGSHKTTLRIFEAVTAALGRPVWGRQPPQPVRTVLVTREDSREILVARMREIIEALNLSASEVSAVLERVLVLDLSGQPFRLSAVIGDVVMPHHGNLAALIETLRAFRPDAVIFDPLVSFGVGEQRVNDAEQGLIEAFRCIRNALDCAVEGIHHSGKAAARDKVLDQYAGRGGSALADGSRMVAVLQPLSAAEWLKETGTTLADAETGLVMALPKLSYSPRQEPIYIRRAGYTFQMQATTARSPEQAARDIADQVLRFITSEYKAGRRYSTRDLELSSKQLNLTRAEVREAATRLKVAGLVIYHFENGKPGAHYIPATVAEPHGDAPPDSAFVGGAAA